MTTAKKIEELKGSLKIDKNDLDEELIRQPQIFFEVSELHVRAMSERDAYKEELAAIDAELDKAVRLKLAKSNDKVTEAMVKTAIQVHPKHEKAFIAYSEAKENSDQLAALKESYHQRRYMLQELCSLHLANYFARSSISVPSTPYDMARERLGDKRRGSV